MTTINITDDRERVDTEPMSQLWPWALHSARLDKWVSRTDYEDLRLSSENFLRENQDGACLYVFATYKNAKRFIATKDLGTTLNIVPMPEWSKLPDWYIP